jgi:glutamyl-tRNA synthetase
MGGKEATYAHLPLINGPDGKRLSKRHGAEGVTDYIEAGYLPEALVNFLSLLGWSLTGEATIFSVEESIRAFELADVQKNPAVFDQTKLDWMNGEYVRALPNDRFNELAAERVAFPTDEARSRFERLSPLIQERTKLLTEIEGQARFLFGDEVEIDPSSWEKVMGGEAGVVLDQAIEALGAIDDFDHDSIEKALRSMLEGLGLNARKGLQPLRVAITGSTVSPPLFESMAVLGRDTTLARLRAARSRL